MTWQWLDRQKAVEHKIAQMIMSLIKWQKYFVNVIENAKNLILPLKIVLRKSIILELKDMHGSATSVFVYGTVT